MFLKFYTSRKVLHLFFLPIILIQNEAKGMDMEDNFEWRSFCLTNNHSFTCTNLDYTNDGRFVPSTSDGNSFIFLNTNSVADGDSKKRYSFRESHLFQPWEVKPGDTVSVSFILDEANKPVRFALLGNDGQPRLERDNCQNGFHQYSFKVPLYEAFLWGLTPVLHTPDSIKLSDIKIEVVPPSSLPSLKVLGLLGDKAGDNVAQVLVGPDEQEFERYEAPKELEKHGKPVKYQLVTQGFKWSDNTFVKTHRLQMACVWMLSNLTSDEGTERQFVPDAGFLFRPWEVKAGWTISTSFDLKGLLGPINFAFMSNGNKHLMKSSIRTNGAHAFTFDIPWHDFQYYRQQSLEDLHIWGVTPLIYCDMFEECSFEIGNIKINIYPTEIRNLNINWADFEGSRQLEASEKNRRERNSWEEARVEALRKRKEIDLEYYSKMQWSYSLINAMTKKMAERLREIHSSIIKLAKLLLLEDKYYHENKESISPEMKTKYFKKTSDILDELSRLEKSYTKIHVEARQLIESKKIELEIACVVTRNKKFETTQDKQVKVNLGNLSWWQSELTNWRVALQQKMFEMELEQRRWSNSWLRITETWVMKNGELTILSEDERKRQGVQKSCQKVRPKTNYN